MPTTPASIPANAKVSPKVSVGTPASKLATSPDAPKPAEVCARHTAGASSLRGTDGSAGALVEWSKLARGSLVLAQDDEEPGYYPAEIVATKANDHVVLVWHGYPNLPEFTRARWALALLHPEAVARVLTP